MRVALSMALVAQGAGAAVFARRSSGVSLRKRLNVNNLVAAPGTLELDLAGLHSFSTGSFLLPTAVRFTPDGDSFWLGRTEYSVAFDAVNSTVAEGGRASRFSDRVSIAATSVVLSRPHLVMAISPQVTALLRGDSGVRAGATAIARFDRAGHAIGLAAGWSGATAPADGTNPAGLWDCGAGYGRVLGLSGWRSRLTPHVNLLGEKSTDAAWAGAVTGGVEYQINERASFDVSVQRFGLPGGGADWQLLVGTTINLGKLQ